MHLRGPVSSDHRGAVGGRVIVRGRQQPACSSGFYSRGSRSQKYGMEDGGGTIGLSIG